MDENPRGLRFLVDLVNAPEASTADLQAILDAHGDRLPPLTGDDADRLRAAGAEVAAVLRTQDVDAAAEAINALLDRFDIRPRLVRLPGRPWSMHVRHHEEADRGRWLLGTAALALGLWLSERGRCAWGRCMAPGCGRYFVDTGRRAPQRFCSPRCATRVRVAAHRGMARGENR